jgi:NAD+ diphosphatase
VNRWKLFSFIFARYFPILFAFVYRLILHLSYLDARWFSREDVREALTLAEYKKAQKTAASKVEQMCKGVEKSRSMAADFNVESGELAPIFVPGPFAIAHHLISSWAFSDQNVH